MTYRFVSGAPADIAIHVQSDDQKEFARKVKEEYFEKLRDIPLRNHAYRIILPDGTELRSLRAERWLIQHSVPTNNDVIEAFDALGGDVNQVQALQGQLEKSVSADAAVTAINQALSAGVLAINRQGAVRKVKEGG